MTIMNDIDKRVSRGFNRLGVIERYREFLPVSEATEVISLYEGETPLIKLKNLPKKFGIEADWYVKFEGMNPTGSFKDRGMTMAITKAKEEGAKVVMCASTGNTSASAAAYAARANMACVVLIPDGKIALGKLSQAMLHGAKVLQINGNFDQALKLVREITQDSPIALVNSVNPYRIEGQKTGAFEIVDELGDAPDFHFIPVGNAGNITAYWKGYKEYKEVGNSTKLPKMIGYQAEGSAPIVDGAPVNNPETIATAIRIGNPASWEGATSARDESGGLIDKVSDDYITECQMMLADLDGVFCEPACAVAIAGVIRQKENFNYQKGQNIVSIITGHGLKDPNRAIEISSQPEKVDVTKEAILDKLSDFL